MGQADLAWDQSWSGWTLRGPGPARGGFTGRGGAGPKQNVEWSDGPDLPRAGPGQNVCGLARVGPCWVFPRWHGPLKKTFTCFFLRSQFTNGLTTNDGTDRARKRPTLQGYYDLAVPPRTKATVLPRNNDVPHKELVVTGITSGLPKKKPAERLLFFRDSFCVRVCISHISSHR